MTLLTKTLGKVNCFSFGSRSPSSQRGYRLNKPYWYEFSMKKSRQRLSLEGMENVLPIGLGLQNDLDFQHHWRSVCELLDKTIPLGASDDNLFDLCKFITDKTLTSKPLLYQQFVFHYGLLHLLGLFPFFDKPCYNENICRPSRLVGVGEAEHPQKTMEANDFIQPLSGSGLAAKGVSHWARPSNLQKLFELQPESLAFLNDFGEHFSNTLSYYLSVHKRLLEKDPTQIDIASEQFKRLVQMAKTLCRAI